MEEKEEWEPACFQLCTAIALVPRTHLSRGRSRAGRAVQLRGEGEERGFPRDHRSGRAPAAAARPRSPLTLREGDDGQGEGEQRQGAELHAGVAGGGGQALLCSARPGGRGALLAAPPPLPL